MSKIIDLTEQKFGRLLVIKKSDKKSKNRSIYWTCKCTCGKIKDIRSDSLKIGTIKSCGCLHKEKISTHGLTNHLLYRCWLNMKQRCYDVNYSRYKDWGGRGIKVCFKWKDNFLNFYNWAINNGWQKELQIDRIDNDGNYCPRNCRFVTRSENCKNRRKK